MIISILADNNNDNDFVRGRMLLSFRGGERERQGLLGDRDGCQ